MSVVSIHRLTKSYGGRPPALRDVTFDIGPGITGLLGPNGAGKSTLLQCILGLLPDYEGSATVLGLDARKQGRQVRRRIGFMPEADTYLPDMTGIRAVRYLGQMSGMHYRHALRRAHEVLFHVGLGEAVYRHVRDYSVGMRQRFKLAQALVHDPELIFLDEPLSGLDPSGREELLYLIRDLAVHHDKHIVWSSHILPDVQKAAEHIVVLQAGEFRGAFTLDDLSARTDVFLVEPEGDPVAFTAALETRGAQVDFGRRPGDEQGLESIEARTRALEVTLPGDATAATMFEIARETGTRLRRVIPRNETLEEAFMRLLGQESR